MTKILHPITLFIIGSLAWILASCCSDDKNCEAGNTSLGTFPYAYGETLVFADSFDNRIYVKLANEPSGSAAYDIDGSCGTPRKERDCESSVSLNRETVTDSSGFLNTHERYFYCTISKSENVQTAYSLSALGQASIFISDYGAANAPINATQLSSYTTPYHTYTNVYINKMGEQPYSANYKKKVVFTQQGKLISFSMDQDTSHVFHIVE